MLKLAPFALILALATCPAKPVTPPVAPPALMIVHVQVNGAGGPLAGALVRLKVALPDTWVEATTLQSGHVLLAVPASVSDSHLQVTAEGWVNIDRHEVVSRDVTLTVQLLARPPPFTPLPRLLPQRQHFALEPGQGFTAIQVSDFNLLNRWQHGEDIEPILQQRQGLGFNLLRVWTLYDLAAANIGTFLDIDYARIPEFLDAAARHGLYVEFTAYTSTERVEHWSKLVAAVQGKTNVILELVNELDQPVNALAHFSEYQRPLGVFASHGSNGAESWPVMPLWDYGTFHSNGAFEEQRKAGHNAMEIWNGPTLTNETGRYPDVGMWNGASLDRQKQLAFDSAAGGALLAAGSCWHSAAGKVSRLFVGDEIEVARAWVAGARSVDLSQQDAPYEHLANLEGPGDLRVYRRGTAVVRIRK
jgi:hypothetical protein